MSQASRGIPKLAQWRHLELSDINKEGVVYPALVGHQVK